MVHGCNYIVNLVNWTWSTSLRLFFLRYFIHSTGISRLAHATVSAPCRDGLPPAPGATEPGFFEGRRAGWAALRAAERKQKSNCCGVWVWPYGHHVLQWYLHVYIHVLQRWSIVYVKTVGIAWYRMHLHTYDVTICNMTIVYSDTHTFSVAQSFHKWSHRRVKLCIFWGSGRIFKIFQRCLGPQKPGAGLVHCHDGPRSGVVNQWNMAGKSLEDHGGCGLCIMGTSSTLW